MRKNGKSCYCTTEPKLSNESGKNGNENIKIKKFIKRKGKLKNENEKQKNGKLF